MLAYTALLALASLVAAQCGPSTTAPPPTTTAPPPTTTAKPPPSGTALHPNGNAGKCLDVAGANFANGTPVQIYDCNGTNAQRWTLNRGNGLVQVAGTNYCLDAGLSPANGTGMKIWQCYPGSPQQSWYYTDDNRIALTGKGFCLDLPSGSTANGNHIQIWQCSTGNNNQVWTSDAKAARRNRYQGMY